MSGWHPVAGQLLTRWAEQVTPETAWQSYPRPQMTRPDWLNLNGLWDYALLPRQQLTVEKFDGQILVPFPIESALSGVKRPLLPQERLWYRRTFRVPPTWKGQRILLHFGAVDWEAQVWLNGQMIGTHQGGFIPFSFEVTHHLQAGENELLVAVWDPTDSHWQSRGKQVLHPKSIWYTAVSGIWQTVWLEPVPETYIAGLKITPNVDAGMVRLSLRLDGPDPGAILVRVQEAGKTIAQAEADSGRREVSISIPNPRLWSPDSPHLYDLLIETASDRVEGYFGMRKFSLERDARGHLRLCLNNQPVFQYGPLDQGYWPDGLYTPPCEEAMRSDLLLIKELGFNMLRKHVKVEPARYYYDCDRLGLIVWQDMPNGSNPVGPVLSYLAIMVGVGRRDDRWLRLAGRSHPASRQDFRRELQEMVDHLHNFACIGMWVPFNEGWGQFKASAVADWLKSYDPTRPVDHASGWFDQGGRDFKSLHVYFKDLPLLQPEGQRALILSEFGGYSLKMDGHMWNPQVEFGYRKYPDSSSLTDGYVELIKTQLIPWIEKGLSAAVYTQTTDVEIEVNGFVTYDRQVVKMVTEQVRQAHLDLWGKSES